MEIAKGELKLISRLLEMAGNEFSNHGCNDMDQALWDEIGFTPEDRATLIHEMQLWNGDTEDPYPTKLIHMRDDMVMNFYAAKLKDGNLAGSPAPTPPLDVEAEKRITEIRERESKAAKGPWHRGDVKGVTDDCVYREDGANVCKALLIESKAQNLDFMAHSRQDIPFLLEQISLLRRHIASPAPQLEVGDPCPTCERKYMGKMRPGEYSCVSCGMGLDEPCEHWKKMLAENEQLEPAASPAQPEKRDE